MAVDSFGGKSVNFTDLPKVVQDTVLYWVKCDKRCPFTFPNDTTQCYGYYEPDVLCFDDQYTLNREKFGPWIKNRILKRISDGKEYKLTTSMPLPAIIRNDTIIIPDDYNILTVWNPSVKWKIYRLR